MTTQRKRPIVLAILDGWGIGIKDAYNAIELADTPNIDYLIGEYPDAAIGAAGEDIGLEAGHQGSTEIGHLIIGAGRNVLLPQLQIKKSLATGEVYKNAAYRNAIVHAKKENTRLHLMGLLSNAGVHSYDAMCHVLLEMAAQEGLRAEQVFIHIFSDGRDTPPESLPEHVARLREKMDAAGVGVIADVQGRYYAMDRDHRWERVEAAYQLLVEGRGVRTAKTIHDAIDQARAQNETDEFISPTAIAPDGNIQEGDVVINFNFRVDREIEISKALIETHFDGFQRDMFPAIHYVATLPYYEGFPAPFAFDREELKMQNILGEVLARKNITQFRVTETEKWVYLTKIFNGMREEAFPGEQRLLIPSDKIATYDLQPRMKAIEIAQAVVSKLNEHAFDVYVLNICNADILGHTGNLKAAIAGCDAVDQAIGLLYEAVKKEHGILMITADHGHAEKMWDHVLGVPSTQHTDNYVPFIYIDDERPHVKVRDNGALRDVAPTILDLLDIPVPPEMTGRSLLIE